jgi:hypothetical protein
MEMGRARVRRDRRSRLQRSPQKGESERQKKEAGFG